MNLPSHLEFQNCGVVWLGDIPAHWTLGKVKHGYDLQLGKMLQTKPEGPSDVEVSYLRAYNVGLEKVQADDIATMWASPEEIRQFSVVAGDLLVCEGGEAGRAAILPELDRTLIIQNALHRVRAKGRVPERFLLYLLQVATSTGWLDVLCNKATIVHFTGDKLANLAVPYPPEAEAQRIVMFLDGETAKIDALIAEQRTLIEKLREKRIGLVSLVITKGIAGGAVLKPSTNFWIGDTPAHWTVCPLKHRYTVELGKMLDQKRVTGQHLAPYLRNTDVQWDSINVIDLPEMDFDANDRVRFLLEKGDLLVCEGGEVGRAAIWNGELDECYYQKALHRIRPLDPSLDDPRFLFYALMDAALRGRFTAGAEKATIAHLPADTLRRHLFAFPDLKEQGEIVAYLEKELGHLNALVSEAENSIALLQEHRSALITAAVTGQIDVREAVHA